MTKILFCSKCGGTLFEDTGFDLVYTVYIKNGSAPYQKTYRCVKCGHEEKVEYPAVYDDAPKPFIVELPDTEG